MSGIFALVIGLVSCMLAATLWFAFLTVLVSPIGIASAAFTLYHENRDREGHSLVNLAGLALNALSLGVFISIILASSVFR